MLVDRMNVLCCPVLLWLPLRDVLVKSSGTPAVVMCSAPSVLHRLTCTSELSVSHLWVTDGQMITGYQGLAVDVWFSQRSYLALAEVRSQKRQDGADDIYGILQNGFPAGLDMSRTAYQSNLEAAPDDLGLGSLGEPVTERQLDADTTLYVHRVELCKATQNVKVRAAVAGPLTIQVCATRPQARLAASCTGPACAVPAPPALLCGRRQLHQPRGAGVGAAAGGAGAEGKRIDPGEHRTCIPVSLHAVLRKQAPKKKHLLLACFCCLHSVLMFPHNALPAEGRPNTLGCRLAWRRSTGSTAGRTGPGCASLRCFPSACTQSSVLFIGMHAAPTAPAAGRAD